MIRRPASLMGTGEAGFVLNWFIVQDLLVPGSFLSQMTFEMTGVPSGSTGHNPGEVTIQPAANIRFDDGSPSTIPTID